MCFTVQEKRLELSWYCYHTDLNRTRLPIPPFLHLLTAAFENHALSTKNMLSQRIEECKLFLKKMTNFLLFLFTVKKNVPWHILAPRRGCFSNHLPLRRVRILAERFSFIGRIFLWKKKKHTTMWCALPCRKRDLNSHDIAIIRTWTVRVCQFRHSCIYWLQLLKTMRCQQKICYHRESKSASFFWKKWQIFCYSYLL